VSIAPNLPIANEMQGRIRAELSAIEATHHVMILLAVESGSRAWGFPSKDSDYDVRFIYLRPTEDYLTVTSRRDVIERPVDSVLDVSGWDVRKALQLLLRSNAVLHEWLSSPVRYVNTVAVPGQLFDLLQDAADLTVFDYHYDHLARRCFDEIVSRGNDPRFKTYCYALRAVLALCWLRDRLGAPPMDLPSLWNGLVLASSVDLAISEMVERKARATEQDTTPRIAVIDELINKVLSKPVTPAYPVDRSAVRARADGLFASIVLSQQIRRK
jgi:uncharacterized protein